MDGADKSLGNQETQPGAVPPERSDDRSIGGLPTMRSPIRRFKTGDRILNRYKVTGELGQGGMGIVYRCHDEVGGIDVALKALPPELSHNSGEMEEVRDNFRLVQQLHHPNIAAIKTLERDSATGDYYLIMECVEGINLRQWHKLKRSGMQDAGCGIEEIVPLVRQVAAALDYAHSQRIIHRDIKPSNIMLAQNVAEVRGQRSEDSKPPATRHPSLATHSTVKVLDFGLAAQIHTSLSRVSQVNHGTSGTGPYMAPEQWRGQVQDEATDQYALAVMIYELLSGHPPFESHDPMVLRGAVLNEKVPPIKIISRDRHSLGGGGSNHWKVLERALSKDRKARFASCTDFINALAGGKILKPRKSTRSAKNKSAMLVGVCLAVIAVGAGIWVTKSAIENRPASEAQIISQGEIVNKVSGSSAMERARIAQEQAAAEAQAGAERQENDRANAEARKAEAEAKQKATKIAKTDGLAEETETKNPEMLRPDEPNENQNKPESETVSKVSPSATILSESDKTQVTVPRDVPGNNQLVSSQITARAEMLAAHARYEQINKLAGEDLLYSYSFIPDNSSINAIREQIRQYDETLASLLLNYGENYPPVKDTRLLRAQQVEKLGSILEHLKKSAYAEYMISKSKYDAYGETSDTSSGEVNTVGSITGLNQSDVYVVQKGDTASSIASQFGITWEALIQYNNLSTPNTLRVGQKLLIPTQSYAGTTESSSVPRTETVEKKIPLLGDIPGIGRLFTATTTQPAQSPPPVSTVASSGATTFRVEGEVRKPGSYTDARSITVLRAIAMASGYTEYANKKNVTVTRNGKLIKVDAKKLEGHPEWDIPIESGDVIKVGRSMF